MQGFLWILDKVPLRGVQRYPSRKERSEGKRDENEDVLVREVIKWLGSPFNTLSPCLTSAERCQLAGGGPANNHQRHIVLGAVARLLQHHW